jgi:ATP-dependent Clp protease ATP-binding subunit ClpA
MPKKLTILTEKLFSLQLKKAIFYAFIEARRQKSNIIDSQLLLFGLLKTKYSHVNLLLKKINKSRSLLTNPVDKLLNKLKINFKLKTKSSAFNSDEEFPHFSRPVKRLLFFLTRSQKTRQLNVITTSQVLNYLLRHNSIAKLVKECLIVST